VETVEWRSDSNPDAQVGGSTSTSAGRPSDGGRGSRPGAERAAEGLYHIVLLSGRVTAPEGSFRQALETVRGFADALKAQAGVRDVRILAQPLNVSSTESLRGDLQSKQGSGRQDFSVRVVYRKDDAAT
jgi:hypothetical protein